MNPMRIWPLFVFAAAVLPRAAVCKFYIESCSSDDKCKALLGYRVMADTRISNVVAMFGGGVLDAYQILGSNNFQVSIPEPEDVIIQAQEIVRIPVSCACSNGIRRTDSVIYSVREEGETLHSISSDIFSGMVTPLQIAEANAVDLGRNSGDQQMNFNFSQALAVGQKLVIPFPCACNGGLFKGIPSMFVSYMVQRGESAFQIAQMFQSSVSSVVELNSMLKGSSLAAGDMLEIPVPACAAEFDSRAADHGLVVPKGTYSITAEGCVQCICGFGYPRLDCNPAPTGLKCPSMSCSPGLGIGEFKTSASLDGTCQVMSCSYRGYLDPAQVFTGLENRNESACPGPSPLPAYRQYTPALTPDASPIIQPQNIISNQVTQTNTTTSVSSAAFRFQSRFKLYFASLSILTLFKLHCDQII